MIRLQPGLQAPPAPRAEPEVELDLSVIVPVTERPEPLDELYREYTAPLIASGRSFEFLFAVQPFSERLTAALAPLQAAGAPIRVLEAGRFIGETGLLRMAIPESRGRIIATLPAYRQIVADGLHQVVASVENGADFSAARRWPRRDPWYNRLQHRVLHLILGRFVGGRFHDIGCGVRAARREALLDIPLYGDFSRFLPLLASHQGFRVQELPIQQHQSDLRGRVYGPGTYLRRLIDVLGLFFLLRFTDKPLRFFGLVGSLLSLSGGALLLMLLIQRVGGQGIAGRPLLLLSVLLLTLGVQAIALGLIGEMIVHFSASQGRRYRVREAAEPTQHRRD